MGHLNLPLPASCSFSSAGLQFVGRQLFKATKVENSLRILFSPAGWNQASLNKGYSSEHLVSEPRFGGETGKQAMEGLTLVQPSGQGSEVTQSDFSIQEGVFAEIQRG